MSKLKTIQIEVAQTDIDDALLAYRDRNVIWCQQCALARALHRQGFPKAVVGMFRWYPYGTDSDDRRVIPLLQNAVDFVRAFDAAARGWSKKPKPITLEIQI